jgi:hypothetical protein
MSTPLQAGQYSARDKDNVAVSPQPGDVEITDAFTNEFDNFNEYGVVASNIKDTPQNRLVAFYDKDNVLLDPQPAYQNLGYVQYDKDNVAVSPAWEPDAAQWVARGFDNQVRTPQPYAKAPLWPDGAPEWYNPVVGDGKVLRTLTVVLNVEQSETLIVTEDDVSEIVLVVNPLDFVQTRLFG